MSDDTFSTSSTFEAVQAVANDGANYAPAEVPTPENSKRKTDSSQLPAGQDSPAPTGNLSC